MYDDLFQYHHQPYVYYQNFAEGTDARKHHLVDEKELYEDLKQGTLPRSIIECSFHFLFIVYMLTMWLGGRDCCGDLIMLDSVSWVKFYGADNEHPGYTTVAVWLYIDNFRKKSEREREN